MVRWKKIGAWSFGLLLIILLCMVWYKQTYSMKVAEAFDVNNPSSKDHILIATQGSEFKDSVVRQVVSTLKAKSVYIKVIDVSDLPGVKEADWTAIVILHTWENWKPQKDVKLFIEQINDKQRLIVLATSGQGNYRIEGIDAITSASKLTEVASKSEEITKRVERLLNVSHEGNN
jgi:hypothetical protein